MTKRGERCKNTSTTAAGKFCHLHQHQQKEDDCSVCLMQMSGSNSRRLECGHTFHTSCLQRWKLRSSTCPVCRSPFDQPRYKIRVVIEPDGIEMTRASSNIDNIVDLFGLDTRHIETFFTDIRFEIFNEENLLEILREIGFPSLDAPASLDAVGATEP